ncbi:MULTISPECIES: cytidylyltransferase domain-containing protein [unclassified Phenylobacterium]|uniref:cytidylyltransferase domain-containing protein n=1 Tax=unclassified Phenylobacterium TaxID=2640670 RepID=UPI00083ACA70|nr:MULTISPECIES: glycosyltransferase family protein [unclassified Phenylobacterium]
MNLAILQARMTSSRLPGKVMAPVLGEPMIGRQLERLGRSARIGRIVVATSTDPSDDPLAAYVTGLGHLVFRGSLTDVLARFAGAMALVPDANTIVRLTADCPLADWSVIDATIDRYRDAAADYASNTPAVRTYPHGLDIEVMRRAALETACREATDPYEREHVTPFIYRRPDRFRLAYLSQPVSQAHLRWTVDLPEDLAFVREVYERLYPGNPAFTSADVAALAHNSSGAAA